MTFLWPELLWLLLAVPLLVAAYLLAAAAQAASSRVRYASLAMVQGRDGRRGSALRRHVPPVAVPARARSSMIVAIARPAGGGHAAVAARDRSCSRWTSRAACARPTSSRTASPRRRPRRKAFVDEQPRSTRIGIVAFAGTARGRAAPDAEPRGHRSPRSTASSSSAARRSAAASSCRSRRSFPTPGSTCDAVGNPRRRKREGARSSLDRSRARTRTRSRFKPVPPGSYQLGRDHPAHRRPAHHRARPDRGGQDGRRPRRARLHRRHRHRRTARSSASKAGRCACASTRRR